MGGDFGSNGSVVWNVFHGPRNNPTGPELEQGPGEANPNKVKVTPGAGHLTVRGKDDSVDTPHFIVTLRFADFTVAKNEWDSAVAEASKPGSPRAPGGDILIQLHVPHRPPQLRHSRDEDLPLEIQIDW